MKFRPGRWFLWALVLLVLISGDGQAVAAQDSSVQSPLSEMHDVSKRRHVGLDHIFQFEHSALGDRTPVILLPGRAEEFQPNSWWKKFYKYTRQDQAFVKRFKLYVSVYDSNKDIEVSAKAFNAEFREHFGNLPKDRQAVLVTYSLGGMVMREAMRDADILNRIHTIYAVAVPFHGSPMFDPDWFSEYMRPPNRSPIRTLWDRFIYKAYLFDKPNLISGLKWDNFDASLPQFSPTKIDITGDQVVHHVVKYTEPPYIPELKKKLVVYASYLENGYTKSNQPMNPLKLPKYVLEKSTEVPKQLVGSVLPFYGISVHSVFTYMNYQLANIPTFTQDNPEGKNTHLYRFNDGVIPLRSMLYMPRNYNGYYNDLIEFTDVKDIRDARIFVNIDHMHIGEYAVRKSRITVQDLLRPKDGKYTPLSWLIHDIKALPLSR